MTEQEEFIREHRRVRDWYNDNPVGVKKVAEWISPFSQYDYSIYEEDEEGCIL